MVKTISVQQDVQAERRRRADALRNRLGAAGTLIVNLVSSPGSGKTSLLEAVGRHWARTRNFAVLVGDVETQRDAQRLEPLMPVRQLTTGGACHLEIDLVERGLSELPCREYDFLFVENIGNLVCPASHDLAEHLRVVLVSSTEGDDKPGKYPKMFRTSHAMLVTKTDLLPYVPFREDAVIADAKRIQPQLECFSVCSLNGEGIAQWCAWLDAQRQRRLASAIKVEGV